MAGAAQRCRSWRYETHSPVVMMLEQAAVISSASAAAAGKVGPRFRDQAVELQRQDAQLRADQRQRRAVGAEHDGRDEAERRADRRRRPAAAAPAGTPAHGVAPERLRGGELRAVEVDQHRQEPHHHARDEVVRRREREPDRREQRLADAPPGRRPASPSELRDEPGAAVAEDEAVGDDQPGEGERQRDHERRAACAGARGRRDRCSATATPTDASTRVAATSVSSRLPASDGQKAGSANTRANAARAVGERVDRDRGDRQREEQREQQRRRRGEDANQRRSRIEPSSPGDAGSGDAD